MIDDCAVVDLADHSLEELGGEEVCHTSKGSRSAQGVLMTRKERREEVKWTARLASAVMASSSEFCIFSSISSMSRPAQADSGAPENIEGGPSAVTGNHQLKSRDPQRLREGSLTLERVPGTGEYVDKLEIGCCERPDELDGKHFAQIRSCDLKSLEAQILFSQTEVMHSVDQEGIDWTIWTQEGKYKRKEAQYQPSEQAEANKSRVCKGTY